MRDRAEKPWENTMHEKMRDGAGKMPKGKEEDEEELAPPVKKKRFNPLGMAQEQAVATDQLRRDRAADMIAKPELQRRSSEMVFPIGVIRGKSQRDVHGGLLCID
jgi:hypothetical protein